MKPIFKANLYFLIVLILSIFLPEITTPILYKLGLNTPLVLLGNHIIIFIIPAIIYIILTKQSIKRTLMFNIPRIRDILRAILIGILAQPVMIFFSYLSSLFFTNDISIFINSMKDYPLWLMIIVVAVTPAITEEITIRGIVLSGYHYKSKHVAAIMTGFMFGVMHLNPQQFLYALVVGMIFAYMVRATGSIIIAMITHFTINAMQVITQRIVTAGLSIEDVSSEMIALNNLSMAEKLAPLPIYFIITIVFTFLISRVIKYMEKENFNVYIDDLNIETRIDYKHENPVNIPFIMSTVVFILYMILNIMI